MPFATLSQTLLKSSTKPLDRLGVFRHAKIIKMMHEGSCTRLELAEGSGLNHKAVGEFINELRRFELIVVDHHDDDTKGRPFVESFTWRVSPKQRDAVRPAMTQRERQARQREKYRATKNPLLQLGKATNAATPDDDQLDP